MISTLWNNLRTPSPGVQILIGSGQTQVKQQTINLKNVRNRGDLAGLLIESLTKVSAPGSSKTISVFYAFSNNANRVPAELATAAAQFDMALDTGGAGTIRVYSLPISYQGGDYLHIWFTSVAFTDPTSQQEIDLTVLAKMYS